MARFELLLNTESLPYKLKARGAEVRKHATHPSESMCYTARALLNCQATRGQVGTLKVSVLLTVQCAYRSDARV